MKEEMGTPPGAESALPEVDPYTAEELAALQDAASSHGVSQNTLLSMIRLELAYQAMGRRRGLFPALRDLVRLEAEGRPSKKGKNGA